MLLRKGTGLSKERINEVTGKRIARKIERIKTERVNE
jgi:hypothetical protein